jgi:hypothetical protein
MTLPDSKIEESIETKRMSEPIKIKKNHTESVRQSRNKNRQNITQSSNAASPFIDCKPPNLYLERKTRNHSGS